MFFCKLNLHITFFLNLIYKHKQQANALAYRVQLFLIGSSIDCSCRSVMSAKYHREGEQNLFSWKSTLSVTWFYSDFFVSPIACEGFVFNPYFSFNT